MGIVQISLKVKNPQAPKKVFEGEFLVDSGATYLLSLKKSLKN